jgi:excisionase family DNA binding protein
MAQQLMAQGVVNPAGQAGTAAMTPAPANAQPGAAASASSTGFDLLSPSDAANLLGVSEADVIASIEAGDLKAKKIGSAYRITRPVLEDFIRK